MSEKAQKFDNIRVNKKEFHKSKQTISLDSINVDQIVVFDKFKHSDGGFQYFIGYKIGEIVKPLCVILTQINAFVKYFENNGKNMSFLIKDDDVLGKYNKMWDKIKDTLSIEFHSMPVYDEQYIKAKVRESMMWLKQFFLTVKYQNEICITLALPVQLLILLWESEKKNYLQVYLEECKYKIKKTKMTKFIKVELESE